jgi:phospholipid transport system substrate-binding protein
MKKIGFILLAFVATTGAATAQASTPTLFLKQKNGDVDRLLRRAVPDGSAEDKKKQQQIKQLAGELLDYGELTKRAMANHWETINPKQQSDLVATLKELIERNYVKQLKSNLDYKVEYTDEKVKGDQAEVQSIVKVRTKGKSTDAEIVYKMHKVKEGAWLVWDVVTDEVSLMRNYKTQFNKIITESGFDELLKKMKKKLNEEDEKS